MKKIAIFIVVLAFTTLTVFGKNTQYSDVPKSHWATEGIYKAYDFGVMKGVGGDLFGFGNKISKSEFITILCNMFKWEIKNPINPTFSDVKNDDWYYKYVETAYANGVFDKSQRFLPKNPITREEMAVMFVKALGLNACADGSVEIPFTDVSQNKGYISVAYDIGMISGTSSTTFSPSDTATREQCASMITRVYEKYYGKSGFIHGFYAISSYSQKDFVKYTDATTLLWSTMTYDEGKIWLNTGGANANNFKVPKGYEDVTSYLDENEEKTHLGVFMDISKGLDKVLKDEKSRQQTVKEIMAELTKNYENINKNPYSGVTIDFEGLKGENNKRNFNSFLRVLSKELKAKNMTLYVTVQPTLKDSEYFDGYDYKYIGEVADKVILMAHDYNPTSLKGFEGTSWHKNAPITPISQVYYGIKAITDEKNGVQDSSKIVLALSFAGVGWEIDQNGKLLSGEKLNASASAISEKLKLSSAKVGFSKIFRNPYVEYTNADGRSVFLWYENEQSIAEKMALARMMGINGISLWRLGNIPNFDNYSIINSIK